MPNGTMAMQPAEPPGVLSLMDNFKESLSVKM